MYGYTFNQQGNLDRINSQIAELEKIKAQMQQPVQPTNLTQNFQLAPTNRDIIKYSNSMEDVKREIVMGETPYFSKDMSVVWIKNLKGEIKTYELNEIAPKDEKDLKIEYLQAQIEELKKEMKNNERNDDFDEPITNTVESEEPTNVPTVSKPNKKSKQSQRNIERNDE